MQQLPIDKVYFREVLVRDKRFLTDLYQNNKLQNEKQILGADEFYLNTLIKIFHLILNNTIPILEENVERIKKAKKLPLFKFFLGQAKILWPCLKHQEIKKSLFKKDLVLFSHSFWLLYLKNNGLQTYTPN